AQGVRGKDRRPNAHGPSRAAAGAAWRRRAAVGLVVAAGLAVAFWWRSHPTPEQTAGNVAGSVQATYVGSEACAGCHRDAAAEWQRSQHAAAMAVPTEETVRGDFDDAQVRYGGVTSTFFRRNGDY